MTVIETEIKGLKIIKNFYASDERGSFTKLYNNDMFDKLGLEFECKEQYYSVSGKDVIRGMHFQTPPHDHHKIVHVIKGSVIDVVLDLRKASETYGMARSFLLDEKDPCSLYIPKGFAHGFRSLEDGTVMLYNVSTGYAKESDQGIKWDTIGFDWGIADPIISARDGSFISLSEFVSPF